MAKRMEMGAMFNGKGTAQLKRISFTARLNKTVTKTSSWSPEHANGPVSPIGPTPGRQQTEQTQNCPE